MKKISLLTLLVLSVTLSACADERVVPQSSPCVGLDDSPCGPKRPVNGKSYNTVWNDSTEMQSAAI